jgi:hypothetical protein
MPWLLRIEGYDPSLPGATARHFSDVGVISGGSDTPAHTYWDRRILVPPSMTRAAFRGRNAGGAAETALGNISIANLDGELDGLAAIEWDGHTAELLYSALQAPTIGDFATLLVATIRHLVVGDQVEITLAERRDLADRAWQPARFAGTGAAEGDAEWTGQRKPVALGVLWQVEAPMILEASLLLSYADRQCGGVMQARDQGVPLRRGGNHPNAAALLAAGFGSADFITCDAEGLLRVRTLPAGPLTLDLIGWCSATQLVPNHDFTTDLAGWTAGAGWSHANARANKAAGTASDLSRAITTEAGAWYALAVTSLRSSGSGVLAMKAGGVTLVPDLSTDIRRVAVFQATGTSTTIAVSADAAWAGWVDDFTCRQVHARAGEMIREILLAFTPLTLSDIEAADIAALHAANDAALGLWTPPGAEFLVPEKINEICATVGAAWWFDDVTGKLRLRRLEAPSNTPDHIFTRREILAIRPMPGEHRLREQVIEAAVRQRPLREGELAGVVTDVARASLIVEATPASATHAPTATEAKLWRDETLRSLFAYPAAAQAEATRRAALHGPKRLAFVVTLQEDAPTVRPCDTVRIEHPRYGIAGGRNFRVLHLERTAAGMRRRLAMTLWG